MGSKPANTPRLALRWLQTRAVHIADQLDPAESRPALHWLDDHQEHEHALRLLTQGATYRFTIYDDTTRYRYEITTAMNHVVRACQDVVRHHSYQGNWTPRGTAGPMSPSHRELIAQARQDVLNQLQLSTQAAETIAYEIGRHRIAHNRSE